MSSTREMKSAGPLAAGNAFRPHTATPAFTLVELPAVSKGKRTAFTLVELLVVIGIIAVLISILLPVVSKIKQNAYAAASQAIVMQIDGACETYHQNFHAYPGPIPNYAIYMKGTGVTLGAGSPDIIYSYDRSKAAASAEGPALVDQDRITMAENMVLGLCGGLFRNQVTGHICYDPTLVGTGPRSLGTSIATSKSYEALLATTNLYKPGNSAHLSFHDDAASADDSQIPEFVDGFTSPMPILYLRAIPGRTTTTAQTNWSQNDNPVVSYLVDATKNSPGTAVSGPYDVSQILSYTGSFSGTWPNLNIDSNSTPPNSGTQCIGVGKKLAKYYINAQDPNNPNPTPSGGLPGGVQMYHGLRTVNPQLPTVAHIQDASSTTPYYLPMDAYGYFNNPNANNTPRMKDRFIVISAGKDRIYGSEDDLTNFGAVVP